MSSKSSKVGSFSSEGLIIRRSVLDDAEMIQKLMSQQESECLKVIYNYPKLLQKMETSYLSITVLDQNESILGCFVFDVYPDVITGLNDYQHLNLWEEWIYTVFQFEQSITPYNSIWLSYMFIGKEIEGVNSAVEIEITKTVFKYVYNTMPEIGKILFHYRKEIQNHSASKDYLKNFLKKLFAKLRKNELSETEKSYLNIASDVYLSERDIIIDTLEIRDALEQDHDDLVNVCNQQSDLNTEVYGEFFIAELIANQTPNRRSIVAQVGLKAIGLLSMTTEIDYNILSKNFHLENYDNLCTIEFMTAMYHRQEEISIEKKLEEDRKKMELKRQFEDEVLKCNIVANRMILQQFCINNQAAIKEEIEGIINNPDVNKKFVTKEKFEQLVARWLKEYQIIQPSDFFDEHPTNDVTLVTNDMTEIELFLETLSFFGLHPKYIEKQGQWTNYEKMLREKEKKNRKRREMMAKKKPAGRRKKGDEKLTDYSPPEYFDFKPLLESFKNFADTGPEIRTKIRLGMQEQAKQIRALFCYENGEPNLERCQDILSIAKHLDIDLQPNQIEGFGWILESFGGCKYTPKIIQDVEKPKEEANELAAMKVKTKFTRNEEKKLVDKLIKLTSFDEFKHALEVIKVFDETLMRLNFLDSPLLAKTVEEKEIVRANQWESYCKSKRIPRLENNRFYSTISEMSEDDIMQNLPDSAKNAVCINIFFIHETFECRAIDFLAYAFELFPDKEYIIMTQPFSGEESVLLQSFIPVQRKEDTNIEHVLYIFNKSSLYAPFLTLRQSVIEDLSDGGYLVQNTINKSQLMEDLEDGIKNNASNKICYTAFNQDSVVGLFVLTKDVNLEYYKSHFCVQYHMLLDQYSLTDHSRLLHSIVNPLFQKTRRYMLREILRLSDKKSLFFEVNRKTILPDVFSDLVSVRRRKFPHFLERKWNLEKDLEYIEKSRNPIPNQDKDRDPLDEEEAQFGVSLVTLKMLSVNKVNNNNRIVVVGASDTGISFIETLLNIKYINFPNIFLLAPGGLVNMHVKDNFRQFKSCSIHYSIDELDSLMLDARITVIDGRMSRFDRANKLLFFTDKNGESMTLNYDFLVLCMGLVDKTIEDFKNGKTKVAEFSQMTKNLYTIDDPYIYESFTTKDSKLALLEKSTDSLSTTDISDASQEQDNIPDLLKPPKYPPHHPLSQILHPKVPKNLVIYGRSLHTLTFVSAMIKQGISTDRMIIVIPPSKIPEAPKTFNSNAEFIEHEDNKLTEPEAFEDQEIRNIVIQRVRDLGIKVYDNFEIVGAEMEEESMGKMANGVHTDTDQTFDYHNSHHGHQNSTHSGGRHNKSGKNLGTTFYFLKAKNPTTGEQVEIESSIILSSGQVDIHMSLFDTVQENGLVYNGRLIVKSNFQTTDPSIFAAGKLVEFSQRYRNFALGRSLRLDKYSGREIGQRLAKNVLEHIGILKEVHPDDPNYEELPTFSMPVGTGGYLPGDMIYFNIKMTPEGIPDEFISAAQNRKKIVSNNIKDGKGHYIRFDFDNNGLIKEVSYLGTEQISVQSLNSLIGLSETYLNRLIERSAHNDPNKVNLIENLTEFLSENWAIALYHEWFSEFRHGLKMKLANQQDIDIVLERVRDLVNTKGYLDRTSFAELSKGVSEETKKMIRDDALNFVDQNLNHLPMYYVPGREFK